MSDGHVVRLQVRIDAPPEDVFTYLTEPERYARWQGVRAELDPRPGGIYRVWMDADTIASGEFVEVVRPERVTFTWGWEGDDEVPPGSTTVRIDLVENEGTTTLFLDHSGLPSERSAALHEQGWKLFVARLATATRGGDPGPMPPLTSA